MVTVLVSLMIRDWLVWLEQSQSRRLPEDADTKVLTYGKWSFRFCRPATPCKFIEKPLELASDPVIRCFDRVDVFGGKVSSCSASAAD